MKSFLEDYGLIIVAVIVVLALCAFAKGAFVTQFQKGLTDTLDTFFKTSGAESASSFLLFM